MVDQHLKTADPSIYTKYLIPSTTSNPQCAPNLNVSKVGICNPDMSRFRIRLKFGSPTIWKPTKMSAILYLQFEIQTI